MIFRFSRTSALRLGEDEETPRTKVRGVGVYGRIVFGTSEAVPLINRLLLNEGAVFGGELGVFWGDDGGRGYLVVGFEVEELYAHGGSAGGADGLGVDADDLSELADDHHLGGVVDELDARDFADLGGGAHVDDALAAAGLEAVGVDVGALAVAVFGDGEDEAGGEAELLVELGGGFLTRTVRPQRHVVRSGALRP
jgi:hypothetical protein